MESVLYNKAITFDGTKDYNNTAFFKCSIENYSYRERPIFRNCQFYECSGEIIGANHYDIWSLNSIANVSYEFYNCVIENCNIRFTHVNFANCIIDSSFIESAVFNNCSYVDLRRASVSNLLFNNCVVIGKQQQLIKQLRFKDSTFSDETYFTTNYK